MVTLKNKFLKLHNADFYLFLQTNDPVIRNMDRLTIVKYSVLKTKKRTLESIFITFLMNLKINFWDEIIVLENQTSFPQILTLFRFRFLEDSREFHQIRSRSKRL